MLRTATLRVARAALRSHTPVATAVGGAIGGGAGGGAGAGAVASWSSRGMATTGFRVEADTMGELEVPADRYWGCQTQRSLHNFKIGAPNSLMPIQVVRGMVYSVAQPALVLSNGLIRVVPATCMQPLAR